jgi:hypothetical protein
MFGQYRGVAAVSPPSHSSGARAPLRSRHNGDVWRILLSRLPFVVSITQFRDCLEGLLPLSLKFSALETACALYILVRISQFNPLLVILYSSHLRRGEVRPRYYKCASNGAGRDSSGLLQRSNTRINWRTSANFFGDGKGVGATLLHMYRTLMRPTQISLLKPFPGHPTPCFEDAFP